MPPPFSKPLLGKNGLGQEGMDPLCPIDDLGHHQIHGDAREYVGIVAGQALDLDEEVEHLARRDLGGFMQIRMQPHGHIVRGGLRPGLVQAGAFVQQHLDFPFQRRLNG
jgi:hypothetical protein